MKKIEFYIGTWKVHRDAIVAEFEPEMEITNEHDDPEYYYIISVRGTWENYRKFLDHPLVKSLEHFEE